MEEAQKRYCLIQILRPRGKLRSWSLMNLGHFRVFAQCACPARVKSSGLKGAPLIYPDPFKPAAARAWQFAPHLTVCQGTTGQSQASTRVMACKWWHLDNYMILKGIISSKALCKCLGFPQPTVLKNWNCWHPTIFDLQKWNFTRFNLITTELNRCIHPQWCWKLLKGDAF